MIVLVIGVVPLFVPVKLRSPVPLAAKPMPVLLLVQLYTVPGTNPLNGTLTVAPLQAATGANVLTVGVGLTVMVKVFGVPGQFPRAPKEYVMTTYPFPVFTPLVVEPALTPPV